ncbi:MAG: NAD-dependent epimerase/dehydratase family protein [Flavobacteriales bacterium]|nr:NAD-dependent epimerase/dehydratase family protein [Flavobacteriales bacterium]
MSKILVTGGAGFIASELAQRLAENEDNDILIVDNFVTGSRDKLPLEDNTNIRFIKCDVNNYESISSIFYSHGFDYVFHYAALVGVQRTLKNPDKVLNDISGIKNIVNLSKNTEVKRVFFSSSSEVYGESIKLPQNEETTPLNSTLPYAVVKNIGEAYLKSYYQEFGLEYTIFRFFNTYGIKQSADFVVSKFIKAALRDEDITVYGDGSQIRTFCFISDNIDACANAFYKKKFINDVVNIGSDVEVKIRDLAKMVVKLTGTNSKIVNLPPLEVGDMSRRKPDITKMRTLLDRNLMPIEKGLKKIIENPHFIFD